MTIRDEFRSPSQRITELLARRALGEGISSELIDWATDMLVAGFNSKWICYLAGRDAADPISEIEEEFHRAVLELGYSLPPIRESVLDYSCFVCRCIVNGEVDLEHAHTVLYEIWRQTTFDPKWRGERRFDVWMYLSDSLQLVEEGYPPMLPEFEGLSTETYPHILKAEATKFLERFCNS